MKNYSLTIYDLDLDIDYYMDCDCLIVDDVKLEGHSIHHILSVEQLDEIDQKLQDCVGMDYDYDKASRYED